LRRLVLRCCIGYSYIWEVSFFATFGSSRCYVSRWSPCCWVV
jgi:hypothetical protein